MSDTFEQTTIRVSLLSVVVDHLLKGKITCPHTYQVGCELVALLSAYREEDRRLFPEVYLLAPGEGDLLPILAAGVRPLQIGDTILEEDAELGARKTAREVLKNCASLAIDGWAVYIQRMGQGFNYGLFRPAAASYSVGAESTLTTSALPAVILRNSAENTVEIVNSVGGRLEISLTTATPSKQALGSQIVEFSRCICLDLPDEERDQAAGYMARLLTEFLRGSHGALLAVAPFAVVLEQHKFSDGVVFDEAVPLAKLMLTAANEQSANAASLLRSHESLLRGMIMSDGVTILGTDGSIKAFRVFVRAVGEMTAEQKIKAAGGARSRAFEVLRSFLGAPLKAILLRSHDGRTEVVVQS
jgi:hypothetical protein